MNIHEYIFTKHQLHQHMLAVLLDPEHTIPFAPGQLDAADLILVGGSTGGISPHFIEQIRTRTHRPIVLFPGNPQQFTPQADALLFLSVLNAQDTDLIVGQQIAAAATVHASGIETLPMGYILIDGGKTTSVLRTAHATPLSQTDIPTIVNTALAGQMMGKQLIYLEAGSGAKTPVSIDIIQAVRDAISIPLIVGGGITTPDAMRAAFRAGADIVVIGNHFEQHPEQLHLFC